MVMRAGQYVSNCVGLTVWDTNDREIADESGFSQEGR